MWKNVLFIATIVLFASCGSGKKGVETASSPKEIKLGKTVTHSYKSLGNGVASISLDLYENNTFNFDFKSIPQPGTDEKSVKISEKGTYTSEGDWKTLHFYEPKFSLAAIFDTDFAQGKEFKVLDEQNVKIDTSKDELSIWGVLCEKK